MFLETKCYNPDCNIGKFEVGLSQPKSSNIFYLVDPIRDLIPNSSGVPVELHIFGGDYNGPYGIDKRTKVQRVQELMTGLSDISPDFYVGPILTNFGSKISKSSKNGFSVGSVRESFPNWVDRLHTLLSENKNQKVIDLANGNYFK